MTNSSKKIDSDDPLFRALCLSLENSEESFNSGILHLSHTQKRFITELKDEQTKFAEHRQAEESVSTWKKIGNFVESIFIALGIVAGVCAAGSGAPVVAAVLITAALWRIGYELVQSLHLGNTIQKALIPQELKDHDKVCQMLHTAVTTIDIASRIALALGTGYSAYQMTGQMKNIFQIASVFTTGASAGAQVTTAIKKAQAANLQSLSMQYQANRNFTEQTLETLRDDVKASNGRFQKQAQLNRMLLEAESNARQAVIGQ